jgi:hypothetical protein
LYSVQRGTEASFANDPKILRVHIGNSPPTTFPAWDHLTELISLLNIDHCVDMLRQVIMCNVDPGMITSFWVKDRPDPFPDFVMQKKCKNPYALLGWARERGIPDYVPQHPSPDEVVFPWNPAIL